MKKVCSQRVDSVVTGACGLLWDKMGQNAKGSMHSCHVQNKSTIGDATMRIKVGGRNLATEQKLILDVGAVIRIQTLCSYSRQNKWGQGVLHKLHKPQSFAGIPCFLLCKWVRHRCSFLLVCYNLVETNKNTAQSEKHSRQLRIYTLTDFGWEGRYITSDTFQRDTRSTNPHIKINSCKRGT